MQNATSTLSLILAISAASPLELAKTRIQTTNELLMNGNLQKPYTGLMDCLKTVSKSEGVAALWKGNFLGIMRFFPNESLNFFIKNKIKSNLPNNLAMNIGAGVFGGWLSSFVFYPIDTVRIFLASSTSQSKKTFIQLKSNFKNQGAKYFYRGFTSLLLSIAIFRGIFFGYYDTFKNFRPQQEWKWLTAYLSGLLAAFCVYPVQTVRKRSIIKKGEMEIRSIAKKEGVRGLYRGLSLTPIQSMVGAGILLYFDSGRNDC